MMLPLLSAFTPKGLKFSAFPYAQLSPLYEVHWRLSSLASLTSRFFPSLLSPQALSQLPYQLLRRPSNQPDRPHQLLVLFLPPLIVLLFTSFSAARSAVQNIRPTFHDPRFF